MRQPILAAVAAAALVAAAAAPAMAQETTVEQLTVIGRYMPRGEPPAQLSRVVDYSDLDLRNAADQDELRHRVIRVAADICKQLGRSAPNHTNIGTSCRDMAVRDAMNQVGAAVAQAYATPRYAYVAPPPAYVAPAAPPPADESYEAPAATNYGQAASATVTTQTITNGPVPDTAANRAKYGGPMSNAGRGTKPIGN